MGTGCAEHQRLINVKHLCQFYGRVSILAVPAVSSLYAGLMALRLEHVTVVGCEVAHIMGVCASFVNVARSVILGCEMSHSLGAALEHLEGMYMRPLDGSRAGSCNSEMCVLFVVTLVHCVTSKMWVCVEMAKA
jgi:hypothetical protein